MPISVADSVAKSIFSKKAASFFLHPGNYALIALLAVGGALLIKAGVIAGSVVAAIATGTLGLGLATVLGLFVFLPLLVLKDKAEMENNIPARFNAYTFSTTDDAFVKLTHSNYSWKDYFLGHLERIDNELPQKDTGREVRFYHRKENLLSRLFALAAQRPWRTGIVTLGILVSIAALTLGLGYLVAPAVFGFMASTFGLMTATLSTGLIGMAGAGGTLAGFAVLATPAVPAIAISLLVLLPLVIVNTIDRVMSALSDKKGFTVTVASVREDGVEASESVIGKPTAYSAPVAWFLSNLPNLPSFSNASPKSNVEVINETPTNNQH